MSKPYVKLILIFAFLVPVEASAKTSLECTSTEVAVEVNNGKAYHAYPGMNQVVAPAPAGSSMTGGSCYLSLSWTGLTCFPKTGPRKVGIFS